MKLLALIILISVISTSNARRRKKKKQNNNKIISIASNDEQRSAQIQLLDLEVQEGIKVLTPFQSGAGKFSGKIKNCIRVLGESDVGLSGKAKSFYDDCKNFIVTRSQPKIVGMMKRKQCQVIKVVLSRDQNANLSPEQDAILPWCRQMEIIEGDDKIGKKSEISRTVIQNSVQEDKSVTKEIYINRTNIIYKKNLYIFLLV